MRQFSQEELVEKIRSERCHIGELYDEINTLKRENANLKDYVKSLKDECISCPENKKNIKQAQLSVLGKLWANISNSKQLIQSHIADGSFTIEDIYMEIDELMAEVQNGKDKG